MLTITIPGPEAYDEAKKEFVYDEGSVVLELEHSLLSLSKWEAEYEKPFLGRDDKSAQEIVGYVKAMVLTPNVSPEIFERLSKENFEDVNKYINAKMTATWFSDHAPESKKASEIITAELIYYWLTAFQIPFECEKWHLNRLFTLIRICNIKSAKPKKRSRREIADQQARINAQRRKELGTKG